MAETGDPIFTGLHLDALGVKPKGKQLLLPAARPDALIRSRQLTSQA